MPDTHIKVTNNHAASRYEGHIGSELVGFCDYRRSAETLVLPYTETLPAFRGRGIADAIVAVAIADAQAEGLTIDPQCWFVREFLRTKGEASHPN